MVGFIKLHRKLQQWEWYNKSEMVHLFIHLLINANSEDGEWQKQPIKRGQLITGLHSLSEKTGISIRTIRTCLDRLKSTSELTIKSTNKFSIITICKYDDYNDNKKKTDKQIDKPSVSPATTNKKFKNKYIENEEVYAAFEAFIEMRNKAKKPVSTDRAFNNLMNALKKIAGDDDELKIKVIDQSILKNYLSFFPIREDLFSNQTKLDTVDM